MNFNIRQKKVINAEEPKILCLATAACGKALPNSVLIPTPNGLRYVGDIRKGDYLFDRYGNPTEVLEIFPQGELNTYEIYFEDGRRALCSKDHIWYVHNDCWSNNEYKEMTLEEIINSGEVEHFRIPNAAPVKYEERNINVSPSLYGYIIGKCSNEPDLAIHEDFRYNTISVRLQLLRAIMSTIGEIRKKDGKIIISLKVKSYSLIHNIKEIFGSLGYVSKIHSINCEQYELIIFIPYNEIKLFFPMPLPDEIEKMIETTKDERRYDSTRIVSITDCNYKIPMTCFLVDNDEHLFLTKDFIVTHNTRVLTERIRVLIEEKNVNPEEIVAITFTNLAASEMRTRLSIALSDEKKISNMFIGTIHSYANSICAANGINTQKYIINEDYDEILKKAISIKKEKYPHVKHVLVDECQDLSELEFNFLNKVNTDNIFYVGDNRQAIYGFRGCSDEHLLKMHADKTFTKYYLTENYRNAPNIISYAEDLLLTMPQVSPSSLAVKTKLGNVEECSFNEALEELELSKNWGSWFILTRTNKELDEIMEILNAKDIPCITFKKRDLTPAQIETIMKSNQVKVLTIHMSKGLENKNVIVVGAKKFNLEERRISYVGVTRAENNLYWCPSIVKRGRAYKKPSVFNHSKSDLVEF